MGKYMHKETGSVDTREGWIESYNPEELEERGLTAEEAFAEDDGNTLIELNDTRERVIFDNGGGVTVQLLGWAHWYNDARQAADDVAEWLKSHDTSGWEGGEPENLALDPSYDDIANGGYRVWGISGYGMDSEECSGLPLRTWGQNTRDFFARLDQINPDL